MSYGDEIMASGHARVVHEATGKRIIITGKNGKPRWSDLWAGLSWIVQPGETDASAIRLKNGPQCRPYIAYPFTRQRGCTYSGWRARDHVGEIRLTDEEKIFAAIFPPSKFTLVEPHIPEQSNPNKQWGWDKWQRLADILRTDGDAVVQVGPPGTRTLDGVDLIETPDFRYGAAVLARADKIILPEGGLHHAAGVMRKRVVVLFGGTVDPEATGYPWHENVTDGLNRPCGAWMPCDHCKKAWKTIQPEYVARLAAHQS